MPSLMERKVPAMAWSPLAGGELFSPEYKDLHAKLEAIGTAQGGDASAVAVAWLLAHPAGILPVMGTNDLGRIARLSDACKVEISRQDWFDLYTAANGYEVP
jgi:predicted oxidoreductase